MSKFPKQTTPKKPVRKVSHKKKPKERDPESAFVAAPGSIGIKLPTKKEEEPRPPVTAEQRDKFTDGSGIRWKQLPPSWVPRLPDVWENPNYQLLPNGKIKSLVKPRTRPLRVSIARSMTSKSIYSETINFDVDLSQIITNTLNGDSSAGTMRSEMRKLLNENARSMYLEGMVESGVFDSLDEAADELDGDDLDYIADWLATQLEAVPDFAKAAADTRLIKHPDRQRAQQHVLDRADLWVQSFTALAHAGKMSALKNEMGVWVLGNTEEHCISERGKTGCTELAGKAHRLSWYRDNGFMPGAPGSATTCGGYHCDCGIKSRKTGRMLIKNEDTHDSGDE